MSNAALAIAAILGILAGVVPVVVGIVLHHFQVVDRHHLAEIKATEAGTHGAKHLEREAVAA